MGYLDDIKNTIFNNIKNGGALISPFGTIQDVVDTAKQNNWNPGQFGQNIAKGVGGLAQGVASLPGEAVKAFVAPQSFGQDVTQSIENIGRGINYATGQPINPQTGRLQLPSIPKAIESAYNDPINTAMLFGPKIPKIGKAVEAVAPESKGAMTTGGAVPKIEPAPVELPPTVPRQVAPPMMSANKIPDDAINNYRSIFQIPSTVTQRMRIKPEQVVNQLINDGIKGVSNVDELGKLGEAVTGPSGVFPSINRIILGDIQEPLDYSEAKTAMTDAIDSRLEGEKKGLVADVKRELEKSFPNYASSDITSANFNMPEDTAHASDLFSATQKLDSLAKAYDTRAHNIYGDLMHPEYERAGSIIRDVSESVKKTLDKTTSPEAYQAYKSDPRVLEQLDRLPGGRTGPLAQRWLSDAKVFRDGRSIQAPYVHLLDMVRHTKNSQYAAFTKWIDKMQDAQDQNSHKIVGGAVAAMVNPRATMASAAATGVKKIISPYVDKSEGDIMRERTSGESASMKPTGGNKNILPKIGVGLGELRRFVGASQLGASNNTENMNNNEPDVNHRPIIAQKYAGVNTQPDSQGMYHLPVKTTPGQGYMTDQQFQDAAAGMSTHGQEYAHLVNQYQQSKARADAKFQNNTIMRFMDQADSMFSAGSGLENEASKIPLGAWNALKGAKSIQSYLSNPKNPNAQEFYDIDYFNTRFKSAYRDATGTEPGPDMNLSAAQSPSQFSQILDRQQQFIANTYKLYQDPYLAKTSVSGTQTPAGQSTSMRQSPRPGGGGSLSMPIGGERPMLPPITAQ